MTRARVLLTDLTEGNLPAVSVKTGRPCTNPVAIAMRPDRRILSPNTSRIVGVVALEERRVREHRALHVVAWGALALLVAGVVAGLVVGSFAFAAAGVAVLVYVAVVVVGDARWIGARSSPTEREIVLTKVHRAFARAVDEQYGRSGSSR